MSFIRLRTGAWILHLNQKCEFERRQEHITEWRSTNGSFEHFTFTDEEIQRQIASGKMRIFNGFGRPPAETENISKVYGARRPTDADLEEASRKLQYVLEVHKLGCLSPEAGPADWQVAIDAVWEREGRHWCKLRGSHQGQSVDKPSLKSVRRWAAYAGPKPRVDRLISNHRHKGNYNDRLHEEVRRLIDQLVLDVWMKRPPITLDTFRNVVRHEVAKLSTTNLNGQTGLSSVSFSAIQSSIDAIPRDEIMRARYGEMAAFLKFGSAEAQADPKAPLDRVELDATPADLFVICGRTGLPLGRPTIIICIDRCTRMVLGWFVTFEKPSVLALMQCLRNSILSKTYLTEMKEKYGWDIRHECVTFGLPVSLVLDRALENVADHVAHLARKIGINEIHVMGGKKPWLKGCVERTIKTMSECLLHPTKGTTFHNTLVRMGYNSEKDAVCTTDDLDYGLHKYFIDIYPREQRRSLNNRRSIDVWNELTRKYPVDTISSVDDVAHLFGRTDFAVPGRHGINSNSMQYFSRELLQIYRGSQFQRALEAQNGKLEYGFDPADIGHIHVVLPHEHRTILVPVAPKWQEYAVGLSLFAHRKIRAYTNETARNANEVEQLLTCKMELLDIMRGSALGARGGIAARQGLARFEGVLRKARSGDDASTTVPGSPAHDHSQQEAASRLDLSGGEDVNTASSCPAPSAVRKAEPDIVAGSDRTSTSPSPAASIVSSKPMPIKKGYRP